MIAVDTAEAAMEMLLEMLPLVRGENGDYESWRYGPDGPPEPVAEGRGG